MVKWVCEPARQTKKMINTPTSAYQNKTYTIEDLLCMAEDGLIAIPNIQRPYVWTPAQLARYVDSLLHGWPCGSLLLWQTGKEGQNIFGTRTFVHRHVSPACPGSEVAVGESDEYSYLILDGQQRMQSLVLAFSAASEGYQATTHEWRRDMGSTGGNKNKIARKLLCFNLRGWSPELAANMPSFFYLDYDEEELEHTACLQWLSEEEILETDGACVPLCRLPQSSRNYPEALAWLQERVTALLEQTRMPVLEVNKIDHKVERLDDDEAIVQIFTRLNTAGTPLTKEQIQAARVKSLWPEFPERMRLLSDELNKEPYRMQLNDDDLVNGFNIVLRTWFRTEDISSAYARAGAERKWGEIWERFARSAKEGIRALQDKKLFYNAEYKSLYVLWFPVAHLSCRNTGLTEETANMMVKWALVTSWAKIWANRSGQYVKHFTGKLVGRNEVGSTCAWLQEMLRDRNLTKAACDTIDNLAASHRGSVRQYYLPLWAWTRMNLQRARFVLSFGTGAFAVDHIVPISWVSDPNMKACYNSLGNCWMLSSEANGNKSNASFNQFLESYGLNAEKVTVPALLDCEAKYLEATQNTPHHIEYIQQRETRMKEEIKHYVMNDNQLYFPDDDNLDFRSYKHDTSGIFRGDEYVQTEAFLKLGRNSRSSYLANIRSAMKLFNLTEKKLEQFDADEIKALKDRSGEAGNCATAWRQYTAFLSGDRFSTRTRVTPMTPMQINDLYRGTEFFASPFMNNKSKHSQQSYLSNIRRVLRDLDITKDMLAAMSEEQYEALLNKAGEHENCVTPWRAYLNFLLGNEAEPRTTLVTPGNNGYNIHSIHKGDEYVNSPEFGKLGADSKKCHLTGIRAGIREFKLQPDSPEWSDVHALKNMRDQARDAGLSTNYCSYWRKYMNYLIDHI